MIYIGKNFLRGVFNILSPDFSGSDSNGSSSSEYIKQHGERYKRRRMLHFAGTRTEGIVPGSPPCVNILGSPTALQSSLRVGPLNCLSQSLTNSQVTIFQGPKWMEPNVILWSCYNCKQSCIPAMVSNKEEFIVPVPHGPPGSPSSLWFSRVGKYLTDFHLFHASSGRLVHWTNWSLHLCINLLLLWKLLQTMSVILFLPIYNNLQTSGCVSLLRTRPVVHTSRCKDHCICISLVPFFLFSLGCIRYSKLGFSVGS